MRDISVFAPLLTYPDQNLMAHITRARQHLTHPDALKNLDAFAADMAHIQARTWEEVYSRTFDLNPRCAPYLSVHLFGEEGFKRAQLMTGLKTRYAQLGLDAGSELPDHIAVVLRFVPHCDPGEWEELKHHCLVPALAKMREILSPTTNPYRHLFDALATLVAAHPEAVHA